MKERLSGRSGGYSSGRQVFERMCVCFSAGDCLVQDIKARNSVTELEGMSGVLSSPGALPSAGSAGADCSGLCPLKL